MLSFRVLQGAYADKYFLSFVISTLAGIEN
jgi:hypothetical protein